MINRPRAKPKFIVIDASGIARKIDSLIDHDPHKIEVDPDKPLRYSLAEVHNEINEIKKIVLDIQERVSIIR